MSKILALTVDGCKRLTECRLENSLPTDAGPGSGTPAEGCAGRCRTPRPGSESPGEYPLPWGPPGPLSSAVLRQSGLLLQRQRSMADTSLMDKLVSLCKRRGFVFQSSEIYGGLGSVWDYGPLGVELKK